MQGEEGNECVSTGHIYTYLASYIALILVGSPGSIREARLY